MTKIEQSLKYRGKQVFFLIRLTLYLLLHPTCIKFLGYLKGRGVRLAPIPWFTFKSTDWLEKNLKKDMLAFEWGSGGSTIFLSSKVGKIVSVEHDAVWYQKMTNAINHKKITNCEYYLIKPQLFNENRTISTKGDGGIEFYKYYKFISSYPDSYFDIVVIDGRARNLCIMEAVPKIKPGGIVVLDNSDREEYTKGINIMSNWEKKDFYGPGPFNYHFWQTSIFRKSYD